MAICCNVYLKLLEVDVLFFFFFGDTAMPDNVFASSNAFFLRALTLDVVLHLPFLGSRILLLCNVHVTMLVVKNKIQINK